MLYCVDSILDRWSPCPPRPCRGMRRPASTHYYQSFCRPDGRNRNMGRAPSGTGQSQRNSRSGRLDFPENGLFSDGLRRCSRVCPKARIQLEILDFHAIQCNCIRAGNICQHFADASVMFLEKSRHQTGTACRFHQGLHQHAPHSAARDRCS